MSKQEIKEKLCLCIDTSTKVASAAVGKSADGKNVEVLYSVFVNDGLTHSENLIPLINQCLTGCKLEASDIDVFACVNGPGSFTGLRIGISTANALAQSVGSDIVGVNSLEAIAYTFKHFDGLIIPMIDARRDNVYTAVFDTDRGLEQTTSSEIKSIDEILESIKDYDGKVLFAGCGSQKAKTRAEMLFADRAIFADGISGNVNSTTGLEIAFNTYFSDEYKAKKVLMPNYVKGTSAKTQAQRNAQAK